MKTKEPKFYNNSRICFIYGFADIQNDVELLEWKKQIDEFKKTYKKAIIVVLKQTSKSFNEISESADLCMILTEEKYNSKTKRNQFIKVINNYLVKPFTGNGIWDIKSMSNANNSFDCVSETISLVEFENFSFNIVQKTIEKMIQIIRQPKDMLFLIVFSSVAHKSAGQICEIINDIDTKGNSYHAFGVAKKSFLEITILGTDFE